MISKTAILFTVAAADDLAWSDCGDATSHAHITDLAPLTLPAGQTTHMVGTGTLDSDQDGGTFQFAAKVLGVPILKGNGNLCEDTTIKFPLNTGSLVVKAIDCPAKAGTLEVDIDVSPLTSSPFNGSPVKISINAVNTASEPLFCLDLTSAPNDEEQAGCSGTADFPSTPACYGNNVLGQEDVTLKIEDFASGAGHFSFTGTGAAPLSCETTFTKDDSNQITFDNCDVSSYAKVKGAQYCSDTDELKATFNPLGVPVPVSVKFPKIDCPASVTV